MIVVALVIFVFLLHVRSAVIPILTLPLGVLVAFIPMGAQHLTASIMSLGGIAVAIGGMVDASIIIIENLHKRLADWERGGPPRRRNPRRCRPRTMNHLLAMIGLGMAEQASIVPATEMPTLEALIEALDPDVRAAIDDVDRTLIALSLQQSPWDRTYWNL
jgi:hypothetical protein